MTQYEVARDNARKVEAASYLEQIQILTLVPNKYSHMYSSEYFTVFEYLV